MTRRSQPGASLSSAFLQTGTSSFTEFLAAHDPSLLPAVMDPVVVMSASDTPPPWHWPTQHLTRWSLRSGSTGCA